MWPRRGERPRLAGVNSFGITGTNAHLVVEEYPGLGGELGQNGVAGSARAVDVSLTALIGEQGFPKEDAGRRRTRLLPLSGKSEGALKELAGRYLSWLDERAEEIGSPGAACDPTLSDMAWTAGVGRSHFDRRAGVVFRDADSLRERLSALASSGASAEPGSPAKVAFVYTGQGSQWTGMGKALYDTEPVARAVLDRCEEVFQEDRGASLLDLMFGLPGAVGDLGDTAWEQPALYALECAPNGAVGQRGSSARRGVGAQRRGDCGGAYGRGLQPGRRDAVRRGAGRPAVRDRARSHGRGLRAGGEGSFRG